MAKKLYQVWHDTGWPESRINQLLGGWPPPPFPEAYIHAANVQANGLREVFCLTTDMGSFLQGNQIAWEDNPGVENLGHPRIKQRDTSIGDVIVDPQGKAYRLERECFREIGRQADREAFQKLLADRALPEPTQRRQQDRGIER